MKVLWYVKMMGDYKGVLGQLWISQDKHEFYNATKCIVREQNVKQKISYIVTWQRDINNESFVAVPKQIHDFRLWGFSIYEYAK